LPPGQYDTGGDWPVLRAEVTPRLDTATWTLTVDGLVERPTTWTWDEIHALAPSSYSGDIHCVTTWSKLEVSFGGVSVDTLLDIAGPRPEAAFVLARSHTGYTTNLPLADVTGGKAWVGGDYGGAPLPGGPPPPPLPLADVPGGKAWVVWDYGGAPLPAEHGGPARLLVPHLYFWKSAKWVSGLMLLAEDTPGFWERNGYHDRGDPWLEQRPQGACPPAAPAPGLADRHRGGGAPGDRAGQDLPPRPGAPEPVPGRAALRGAPHRARRLHRLALVLGGVRPRRQRRDRPHGRAAGRRRGVRLPARGRPGRGPPGGARPDRRLVRVGRRCARAAGGW